MSSSLPVIENLLQEFYLISTTNTRKREIEQELLTFKSQPEAWQLCLSVAASLEENQFLWFFCTSTLEHTITRRWSQLTAADRLLLRETLWNAYANITISNVPRRQCDTFAQLIALIGKRQFPDEHPNYMQHCIELIKTKFPLGINLLRITSEEVVSSREDVTTDRKQYFHSCISMCIPDIMDLITKYLLITVCHVNGKDLHTIPNTLMDSSLFTSLPNDNQLSSSILDLLTCVQHIVSWIRTDLVSEYFLLSIMDLSQWRPTHKDISTSALSVLNELFYLQKPLPYPMTLITGINGLLDQHNTTKDQSEMYVDKFRELLRLYTVKYWSKLIHQDDLLEFFMNGLYCSTIRRNGAFDFMEKLEIWTPIIKGLVLNVKLINYQTMIHALVLEIVQRIQFGYNKTELELLDNEMDENLQSEWQQFINQCIECIALVADDRPNLVFLQIYDYWRRPYEYVIAMEQYISNGKSYELIEKLKGNDYVEHLRDFSTVCQAVVRIVPLLDFNNCDPKYDVTVCCKYLADNLITTLKFFSSNKIIHLDIDRSNFQNEYDHLYAQILTAIRSILTVSDCLKSEEVLKNVFDILGGIFQPGPVSLNPIIYLAASQLLLCLTTVIRPKYFLEVPAIVNLMQTGPRFSHLSREVIANIYTSIISNLVQPWKNVEDQSQDFPRRSQLLHDYMSCLAQNFLEVDYNSDETKVSSITLNTLGTLSFVIDFFRDSSNTTKDILVVIFKPILTKALMIYNHIGMTNSVIALTVAEFSLSMLQALQNQLGAAFIKEVMALFIGVCCRAQLSVSCLAVVEKILQMFQIIVEQPGNTALSILPSILDFTIEHILPLMQYEASTSDNNTDITNAVYVLFDRILLCKWQYFYKPQNQICQTQSNSNSSSTNDANDNLHPEHFMAILNTYGQQLVSGTDPNIVRIVLQSMQNVNDRSRLYQRQLFKENLLSSFQSALITVLLSAEGALHYELLANILFTMGEVDSHKLRDSFVKAGFPTNFKIVDEICISSDIPTFSQKLSQLIQDAHCLHLTQQT